jgi:hypothetical protein
MLDGAFIRQTAARGVVAAMAMSGMRQMTTRLGLLDVTPPQLMAEHASTLIERLPERHREPAIELAHWLYGGVGAVGFSLAPSFLRERRWAGPVYGLGAWLAFEAVASHVLGRAEHAERRPVGARLALAADHILYGVSVASSRRPRER